MSAVLQEVNAGIAAAPVIAKPATSEPDASAEHAHQHRDSLDAQEAAKARNALFAKMFADRAAATKREADEEARHAAYVQQQEQKEHKDQKEQKEQKEQQTTEAKAAKSAIASAGPVPAPAPAAPAARTEKESANRPFSLQDFQIGRLLGKGKFGSVYLARELRSGTQKLVALKVLNKGFISKMKQRKQVMRESRV